MKEIYSAGISSIKYRIFVDGIPTIASGNVTVSLAGTDGVTWLNNAVATSTSNVGEYSIIVPPGATAQTQKLTAVWNFVVDTYPFVITEQYMVTTPYAEWSKFVGMTPALSYADFKEREVVSRYIIEAFCGQKFFKESLKYNVIGSGMRSLSLPRSLLTLNSVTWPTWTIPGRPGDVISSNQAFIEWEIYGDGWLIRPVAHQEIIDLVHKERLLFTRDMTYIVDGIWGFDSIPGPVVQAANILVEDFICDQHKYRDRYLKNVTFDKWDITFLPEAFETTGNVLADQMLQEFSLSPSIGLI